MPKTRPIKKVHITSLNMAIDPPLYNIECQLRVVMKIHRMTRILHNMGIETRHGREEMTI